MRAASELAENARVSSSAVRLDRLGVDEGPRLRAIRLRALADAPDAFGTTLEDASGWPAERWSQQVADMPTFVAVVDGADVGMARCHFDPVRDATAWLISMWVAPHVRRRGIASELVDAVIDCARRGAARRVVLDVADANAPAIALYDRKGFVRNGQTGTLSPSKGHVREHQRELRLLST